MTPLYERGNGILLTVIIIVANLAMICAVGYLSLKFDAQNVIESALLSVMTIIFIALIIIGVPFLWSYHKNINDMATGVKNHIDDVKNRHITMTYFGKEICISANTLDKGDCCLIHRINIYNHHKTKSYDNYKYVMNSSEGISKPSDFEFWLNDNEQPTNIPEDKFIIYTKEPHSTSSTKKTVHECEIDIPLGIQGDKSGKLKIHEKACPCFSELHKCKDKGIVVETIGLMVYYPTEILNITVKLDNDVNGYMLKSGGICPLESGSGSMDFKVVDRSNQRIEPYEHKLVSWGAVPIFEKNGRKITWEVHSPKVGYRYHLPFALVRDNIINLKEQEAEKMSTSVQPEIDKIDD
ncbi:MAG: hypothetical protein O0V67_01660 [Methanocorpusculum sp.]|nr:hypothetical protein [Methanocorpusculum sp.]